MSDGYKVLMADVQDMASTFDSEAGTLSCSEVISGVRVPDGGDSVINSALSAAVQAAEMATTQLAAVIAAHGSKLDAAYNQYRTAEESSTQLCQQLTKLIGGSS
ncbi:MAG TPA: DUF6317 family protein [Trebonia sp.]|jgi:hypothetical protein|nr:DUF6317 family protein [Trebonia sp.]